MVTDLNTIRLFNAALALANIPPAVYLLIALVKEKQLIKTPVDYVNKMLRFLFSGIIVASLVNSFFSLALISDAEYSFITSTQGQMLVNGRNAIINLVFLIFCWALSIFRLKQLKSD